MFSLFEPGCHFLYYCVLALLSFYLYLFDSHLDLLFALQFCFVQLSLEFIVLSAQKRYLLLQFIILIHRLVGVVFDFREACRGGRLPNLVLHELYCNRDGPLMPFLARVYH